MNPEPLSPEIAAAIHENAVIEENVGLDIEVPSPVTDEERSVGGAAEVVTVKNYLVPENAKNYLENARDAGDAPAESAEDRDTRTPPWKTPEGKARIRLVKARKRQRRARRVQQAVARAR